MSATSSVELSNKLDTALDFIRRELAISELFVQSHIQENPLSHEAVQGRLAFYKHKTSTHLEIFLELQNSFSLDELPDNLLERFQTVAEEFKRHHENVMLAMSELTVRFFLAPPPKIPNMSISETDHFQNALKAFLNSLTVENGIEGVSAGLGDCSVCSESLEPSTSPVVRLSCHDNHVFHKDCIMEWMCISLTHTCPLCRVRFLDDLIDAHHKSWSSAQVEHN